MGVAARLVSEPKEKLLPICKFFCPCVTVGVIDADV